MALYDILSNRGCINILKVLYDEEVVNKRGYTLNLSTVREKLNINHPLANESRILRKEGLVSSEQIDDDFVMSITEKGKKFIEIFDQVAKLMRGELKEEAKKPSIEYSLNEFEKRILLFVFKITKESGKMITTKELTEELFPFQEARSKKTSITRHLNKLSELNLIKKMKEGRKNLIGITDSGKRVVKEQFIKIVF